MRRRAVSSPVYRGRLSRTARTCEYPYSCRARGRPGTAAAVRILLLCGQNVIIYNTNSCGNNNDHRAMRYNDVDIGRNRDDAKTACPVPTLIYYVHVYIINDDRIMREYF